MYWKLLLLLGVFTEFSVSQTPVPELQGPTHDLRHCFENIVYPNTTASENICHNFTDFRKQIQSYTTAFKKVHNDTEKQLLVPNEENISLMEYAINSTNYKSVVEKLECMNLTLAYNNCSKYYGITNSSESHKLQQMLFGAFVYKTASCGRANHTKACVIEIGLAACDDMVKEWASDLFDYSIEKCNNVTALEHTKGKATGKQPLPLLMTFMVMTAASVFALSPALD